MKYSYEELGDPKKVTSVSYDGVLLMTTTPLKVLDIVSFNTGNSRYIILVKKECGTYSAQRVYVLSEYAIKGTTTFGYKLVVSPRTTNGPLLFWYQNQLCFSGPGDSGVCSRKIPCVECTRRFLCKEIDLRILLDKEI